MNPYTIEINLPWLCFSLVALAFLLVYVYVLRVQS